VGNAGLGADERGAVAGRPLAQKQVVLLVYAGEDHGLRKRSNQIDDHQRIVEWFGHYLKGEPPPAWITTGLGYLEREQELKRLKTRKTTSP
jgi:hypothetical protein